MKQVVCPKCLHDETVTDNATAWCLCGKDPKSQFAKQTLMIPIEQLTKETA